MASNQTESFWLDYLSSRTLRATVLKHQKELMDDRKIYLKSKHMERKIYIENQLKDCPDDIRAKFKSHTNRRSLHIMLYEWLNKIDFQKNSTHENIRNSGICELFKNNLILAEEFNHIETDKDNKSILDIKNEINEPLFRSWKEMPVEKFNDRISKGEILPRDEWIPGVSGSKRNLKPNEAQEHLNFAQKLLHEGRESFKKSCYSRSLILFHQGIQLLSYVECSEEDKQKCIVESFTLFLKNHALSCLKNEEYHEAIKSSTQIIENLDEHDGKALWIRARSHCSLGKLKDAKMDYVKIIKSPYTLKSHKLAAQQGLLEIGNISRKNNDDIKSIFQAAVEKNFFSFEHQQKAHSKNIDKLSYKCKPNVEKTKSSKNFNSNPSDTPLMDHIYLNQDNTKQILEDLLDSYTKSENKEIFEKLWKDADYEERRIILRLKNILPPIQSPIFSKHGLNEHDHHSCLKTLEISVNYWKKFDPEIRLLQQDCWKAIFGEIIDL